MTRPFVLQILAAFVVCCNPARQYPDYSKSSGFELTSTDSTVIDNIELLGRVWGFAKYHHPVFADSTVNIDYELFELLPKVARAGKEERNNLLERWVDGLGGFRHTPEKYRNMLDTMRYQRLADCIWTEDSARLGASLSGKLQRIRHADRRSNIYFKKAIDMEKVMGYFDFSAEKGYPDISYKDTGYRLLALFRYWNIMEYFFPYKDVTDNEWDGLLRKYTCELLAPGTEQDYLATISRLVAEINDSHASAFHSTYYRSHAIPVDARFIGDKLTVFSDYSGDTGLMPGDRIVEIDFRDIDEMVGEMAKYIPASNTNTLRRNAAQFCLFTDNKTARIEYLRDGKRGSMDVATLPRFDFYALKEAENKKNDSIVAVNYFYKLNDSTGYLAINRFEHKDTVAIFETFRDTKALIFDFRGYPKDYSRVLTVKYLMPETHVTTFTFPIEILPGYFYYKDVKFGYSHSDIYKGKIAVLVDSHTMSQSEYNVMMFQTLPNVVTVGSQTAGADGYMSHFKMPGDKTTVYSSSGVYYPDGTGTQRTGIRVDHYAEPTADGVKAGRDEILEKALEVVYSRD